LACSVPSNRDPPLDGGGGGYEKSLRDRQEELEAQLVTAPAATWPEAAEKARYLLGLFASTAAAQDARRKMLIAAVLEDFVRLSAAKGGE
jgi:hypothetical protein